MKRTSPEAGHSLDIVDQGKGGPGSTVCKGGVDTGPEELLHLSTIPLTRSSLAEDGGTPQNPGPLDHPNSGHSGAG